MDDLLDQFLLDTAESLPAAEAELVAWEASLSRRASLDAVWASVHAVKDAAEFLRLHRIRRLAAAAETLITRLRQSPEPAGVEASGLLFRALDGIREAVGHLELVGVEPDGDDAALIGRLAAAASAPPAEQPGPPFAPAAEPVPEPVPPRLQPEAPERRAETSVRVDIDVLGDLSVGVHDLVRTRDQLLDLLPTLPDGPIKAPLQRLSVITGELEDGVLRARRQPIGAVWRDLPRWVRDLSLAMDKSVELVLDGGGDRVDRDLIDALQAPLIQLVRNSLHGLERPEERRAAGKAECGLIHLAAWVEDDALQIRVTDDGRGLDAWRIREFAATRNWLSAAEAAALSDAEAYGLIFLPGYTAAESGGDAPGRGVGLDIVRAATDRLGGRVVVRSALEQGTAVTLRIPLAGGAARTHGPDVRASLEEASGPPVANVAIDPIGEPRRVLLVEENAFFRQMMTPLLTAAGYQVTPAATADEVWRIHDEGGEFDAVVSDIDTAPPGLARRLSGDSRWSAALHVALTDLPVGRITLPDGFTQVVRKSDRQGLIEALANPGRAA